jgi:hypothetical protein
VARVGMRVGNQWSEVKRWSGVTINYAVGAGGMMLRCRANLVQDRGEVVAAFSGGCAVTSTVTVVGLDGSAPVKLKQPCPCVSV